MKTLFYRQLEQEVARLGGLHNAHLHLDRAGTSDPRFWGGEDVEQLAGLTLSRKHGMIPALHKSGAYEPSELARRVNTYLDMMVAVNTRRADTVVDVTLDEIGLSALQTLHAIKQQRRDQIDLRLGAYSPLGYLDAEPERWALLEEGLAYADFIGSLPEVDAIDRNPTHIGFNAHLERILELGKRHHKEIHLHLDQRHEASETGTESLLSAIDRVGAPISQSGGPMVWAVHVLSPNTYAEPRFQALLEGMVRSKIGIICCPSAALGMRQLRPLHTPTGNSIARVLEMSAAGIQVRLGNDNIDDICSPSTTADLFDEVMMLSAALRFYDVRILARLAAGQTLDDVDIERIRQHLESDRRAIDRMLSELGLEK
ncbi:MAG: hypothetical protein GY703_11540 [Gammaproteobacteria bacterium]|nr:hypothetical protein [Gammaproteobacteria bacterium]